MEVFISPKLLSFREDEAGKELDALFHDVIEFPLPANLKAFWAGTEVEYRVGTIKVDLGGSSNSTRHGRFFTLRLT